MTRQKQGRGAIYNRRGYWLRQLSDCAEADFSQVLTTLAMFGGTNPGLYPKCMDGVTWQGEVDAKTPLQSVTDVFMLWQECFSAGVAMAPVVVPRGDPGESDAHGALAARIGSIIIDAEAGTGFYDRSPISTLPSYVAQVRQAAPDAYIVWQPDPRNAESVLTSQVVGFIDCLASQHYVGWDSAGWSDVVSEVGRFDALRAYGVECAPTLYGEENHAEESVFWRAVRSYSIGVQFFRFGTMGVPDFTAAASCILPFEAVR